MRRLLVVLSVLAPVAAFAQTSPSFKLQENAFNAGGRPNGGALPSSSSYRISLDSIGDAVVSSTAAPLTSASFKMDAGSTAAYPPPGEVLGLTFPTKTTLAWTPEKSVGTYGLYRGTLSSLPGTYGSCLQSGLTATTATDLTMPPAAQGFFYLVTAKNRLGEEGTKGLDSSGAKRPNPAPCP